MTSKQLIRKIFLKIKKTPFEEGAYRDLFSVCRDIEPENFTLAHDTNKELRAALSNAIGRGKNVSELFAVYKNSLLFDAPYDFDSYMLYIELDREPRERFYQPRRRQLLPLVRELQKLVDDELDELFISLPPRVGKTTLLMFFMTWIVGRNSELSNLYSAYSDTITRAFYSGVLEIINDPVTYLWHDVFPKAQVVQTNAQEEILNVDRRKRYPSLTARSLYGTLNGACDCNGFLIADDLIGSIEEALNKDRLISAWSKVDNNLLPRAKETAKFLWVGTRWSLIDPIGLRQDLLLNDVRFAGWRYKIINVPALNDTDESNFEYGYEVGFSTDYYRQRRASFERNNDMASWNAQYMGAPIERDGALFSPGEMRYYNGVLPEDKEPDRVFMACDPAFGGGDFVAAPVCVEYGEDVYVPDVVYDNSDKTVTQPLLARAIQKNNVSRAQIEATKATEAYAQGVSEELARIGYKIPVTTKAAPNNKSKAQRIFDKAPDIRQRFIFLEPGKRSKAYEMFMQNLFSYKMFGKNKNDDAPDSLAMCVELCNSGTPKYVVFPRFF